jgi:hypothetical protein
MSTFVSASPSFPARGVWLAADDLGLAAGETLGLDLREVGCREGERSVSLLRGVEGGEIVGVEMERKSNFVDGVFA